jgi:redox-sensitive bicupin YhaK (pirin superfamily)
MNTATLLARAPTQPTLSPTARRILYRTSGHTQGGITRLMSPGDLGELVKPFVFLDRFEFDGARFPDLPMHPHSGIATHTTLLDGSLAYADSTGKHGRLQPGSIEYMQAGGGVWHTGKPGDGEHVRGFQLWVALPPELENAPALSHYVDASVIPIDGDVRVLLGSFGDRRSVIPYPSPVTYLHVRLRAGEAWSYLPTEGHDVAWLAVSVGSVRVDGVVLGQEMAVFDEGDARIDLVAVEDSELVIGSAVKHPHELVTGMYSVHTSEDALLRGEAGYRRIPAAMRRVPVGAW